MTVEIPEGFREDPTVVRHYSDEELMKDIAWRKEKISLLEQKNQDKARVVAAILRDRLQSREEELRRREESQTKSEVKPKPKSSPKTEAEPRHMNNDLSKTFEDLDSEEEERKGEEAASDEELLEDSEWLERQMAMYEEDRKNIGRRLEEQDGQSVREMEDAELVEDLDFYRKLAASLEEENPENPELERLRKGWIRRREEELQRREKADSKPKPFFPREVIDRIKQGVQVLDYFSRRCGAPRREGKTYKALCPLHQEKNPSFTIYPDTNSWHCFGCGKGGDIITLVRELEGLGFVEAIEHLAPLAGVNISPPKEKGTEVVTPAHTSSPTSKSRRATFVDLGGGSIAEMIYNPETNKAAFVVREVDGTLKEVSQVVGPDGCRYLPMSGDLIENEVIGLPTEATPYASDAELLQTIRQFIHRYVEVPAVFETICSYYAVLTWLYDQVPVVPYLRALGDYGTGKTRLLRTVGSLCYTPIFVAGSVTAAPIYRILEMVGGTLIIDEADFAITEAWADIIKILNCGYERGFPVLRCEADGTGFCVKAYDPYGPKVIASRKPWRDEALESRCLTNRMRGLARQDIPLLLPPSFRAEAVEIRNQLLFFRLHNYGGIEIEYSDYSLAVEPRLAEIYLPLRSIIADPEVQGQIDEFMREYHRKIASDRGTTLEATVLGAVIELFKEGKTLFVKAVTERANAKLQDEAAGDKPFQLTTHKCGRLLRNSLGLDTRRGTGGRYEVVVKGDDTLSRLATRYGLDLGPNTGPEKEDFDSGLSFGPLA